MDHIPIGGMAALDADDLTPVEFALDATDCVVDDGAIRARPGTRSVFASNGAVAVSGVAKEITRFRWSLSGARAIVVIGGTVYAVTDPTSEVAEDGSAASLGSPFSSGSTVTAVPHGKYCYLFSDSASESARRITPSLSLEDLQAIPAGAKPSLATSSALAFTVYRTGGGITTATSSGASLRTTGIPSTWYRVSNSGDTGEPASGEWVRFKMASDFDARASDWMVAVLTPRDSGTGTNHTVEIQLARDVSGSPGTFYTVGAIYDVPPIAGSPNVVWCNLAGLDAATRQAVRYIRYMVTGPSGGKFAVYGHLWVPSKLLAPTQYYYVQFIDNTTKQASPLTERLQVDTTDADVVLPTYPSCYLDAGAFKEPGVDEDPMGSGNLRIWNRYANRDYPTDKTRIGRVITITGTTPATSVPTHIVLFKETETGIREVARIAYPGASTAYSITDMGGTAVLSGALYRAQGSPPQCTAAASYGGRLVVGYENRIHVSSYIAPGETSDPFPQFPSYSVSEADGWPFDIAQAKTEAIQALVSGDALYILTNEACRCMPVVTPNSPVYWVWGAGAVGRHAAVWVEDRLVWASSDGCYWASNRALGGELSQVVRRVWREWLQPNSATVMAYQDRALYVFVGTKFMRYSFSRERWTRGTLPFSVVATASWRDPGSSYQQLWLLDSDRRIARLQAACDRDMGAELPMWTYSSGMRWLGTTAVIKRLYAVVTGQSVRLTCYNRSTSRVPGRTVNVRPPDMEVPGWADYRGHAFRVSATGPADSAVELLAWEVVPRDAQGGAREERK